MYVIISQRTLCLVDRSRDSLKVLTVACLPYEEIMLIGKFSFKIFLLPLKD
jgi:hypothetical protein